MAHHPNGLIRVRMVHAFSYQPPCRPHIQPKEPALTVALGPREGRSPRSSLAGTSAHRAVWSHSGGLHDWTPWVSGTAPPGFPTSQPGGSEGQRQPPGSLADAHHRHRMQTDNKRNIKQCRGPLGSSRQTEQRCPGPSVPGARVLFPRNIKKEPTTESRKKDPRSWHISALYPGMYPSPQYLLGPPPTSNSRSDAGAAGTFRSRFPPYPQPRTGNAPPPGPPASSQVRPFLPKTPILLQRPAHPQPPP